MVLLTILPFVAILYAFDVVVTLHHVGFSEFEAPRWTSLPGGLTYWFLVLSK